MDRQELRLELIRIAATTNSAVRDQAVVTVAKTWEEYITSEEEDKVITPSDDVKEQQNGKAVPSKSKPLKGIS
tara:strand:+ start:5723 stop:5941 length:219 start_codon:yes stop_codon:yes gene_type:complete